MSRLSGKAETISSSAESSISAETPHHSRTSFPDYRHEVERVWNHNSAYWDSYMGEGNDFVDVLCWPAIEKLLSVQPGQLVLDVACGNGLTSRRLGRLGASVVAFDVAEEMIRFAKQRSTAEDGDIRYFVLDANDEKGMAKIGEEKFDGALSNMALFDMAEIEPLFRSLFRLLKPGGRFVFSMMHPCFNQASSALFGEREELDGEEVMTYGVRVSGYMTPTMFSGRALGGQPLPQPFFHRPLFALLNVGLEVGFVLDGIEERAFPTTHSPGSRELSWGPNFSEIPPVIVFRMLRP